MTNKVRILETNNPNKNPLTCPKRMLPNNSNTAKHTVVEENIISNKNVQIHKHKFICRETVQYAYI